MNEEELLFPYPECPHHTDCFALEDGKCTCLIDVDFGERDCPFYKDRLSES